MEDLVSDKVDEEVKEVDVEKGCTDITPIGGGKDDDFILYERSCDIIPPNPGTAGVFLNTQGTEAVHDGLLEWGTLGFQTSKFFSFQPWNGYWSGAYDCDTGTWSAGYIPPRLRIIDERRPLMVYDVIIEPEASWTHSQEISGPGSVTINFQPVGNPVEGTPLEVFVHSSAGVRWFQFTPIPAEPPPPPLSKMIQYEVQCKHRIFTILPNDPELGVFNPMWPIDPPPLTVLPPDQEPLREWMLAIEHLRPRSVLKVFSVNEALEDPTKFDPALAQLKAMLQANSDGFAAVRVATAMDQKLVVLAAAMDEHIPSLRVGRHWLLPLQRVEFDERLEAIARVPSGIVVATSGAIRVIGRSGHLGPILALQAGERYVMNALLRWGQRPEMSRLLIAAANNTRENGYSPGTMAIVDEMGKTYVIDGSSLVFCTRVV